MPIFDGREDVGFVAILLETLDEKVYTRNIRVVRRLGAPSTVVPFIWLTKWCARVVHNRRYNRRFDGVGDAVLDGGGNR